ncbi:hypothetical protein THRCLA_08303 [Thraustotheca clavata]|uniref:Uncharacterized protein n=1 Tax=Thraustotheca clavata TaxID=74557 RepID=A0A1V9Z7F8_9STRA|nr:hypothetical protein THRCLA_08303 [Thraustotheca clavata]
MSAERQDDSKHFAASYWKQQLLDAKEQLHASLTVHRRELQTLERHQRLNHALDISLPTEESLFQNRFDTLCTIVKRDYRRKISNDDFLDQGDISFVASPGKLFEDVYAFFTDRQERVQVYNSNRLIQLSKEYTIASELLEAIDKHRGIVKEEEEAVALHLARLKMKNTYEPVDLEMYLRALEVQYTLGKISSRFSCRMKWITFSHRDQIRLRINEITRVTKEPNAPPCFLDSSNAIDDAIVSLLAKLGLDNRPELETDDDLYGAVRQLFPTLFTQYLEPSTPGISSTRKECSIFPQITSIERQQELQLLRQGDPDMLLEAEANVISVNQITRVLDRLELLARNHQNRSQAPSKDYNTQDFDKINDAKLKSYYLLRHLYLRQCKNRILHLLNISRYIEHSVFSTSNDRIIIDSIGNGLCVVDSAGKQVIYEAALDDMKALDKRLNALGTHFLRNAEKQTCQIIDRTRMLCDLYECSLWYLDAKVRLLCYLFDHIYLETSSQAVQLSIRQSIITLIASQALVDFSQTYFWDAFTAQIVAMQFTNHSTTMTNAIFSQYYVGDALIEKAINELSRGGVEYMTYLSRGIRFFQLQTEIATLLYATAHLEMLGRQRFSLAPQDKASYLSQSLAIEALDFASVTRVASMLDWVQLQIATEGRLEWLLAAKAVQTWELRFIETCVTFNAMLLHPVYDFYTIYPWLFDKHMKKIKTNPHLDANQRSYLMHLDSAVGQRVLAEKVEVKVREELKIVGNFCVSFDTKRRSIQSELNGAFEIKQTNATCDDILRYDMIREYIRQLNDDVQVERLLEQLFKTWNNISLLVQDLLEPLTNPFTPLQPDPLETWFLQELLPLDERATLKTEEVWDPMQHLLKLPSARNIVRQYADNDTIRPTLHVISAFQALVDTYYFRAVLHRQFVNDVFGHEIRELVNQLELHCQPKQNPLNVMREWLENKLELMETSVFLTIKILVDDILPTRLKSAFLAEGRSVFKDVSVPAASNLVLGLSDLDCETLRVFWRNLETRVAEHHGIVYLHKYEAFVSLKRYYLTTLAPNSSEKHENLQMIQMKEVILPPSNSSSRKSSTIAMEFDVPQVRILDQFIDNLRNYIELMLVHADMKQCSQLFQSILTPPPMSILPESYPPAVEGIITSLMQTMSQSKEEFKMVASQFVHIVKEACQQHQALQNQTLSQENTQLRQRIQTLEKTQAELESKLERSLHETEYDRNAAVVDKTYGIIFQLENSRHELATAADEFEIERGNFLAQVHSEYEKKLRDLSLDLVTKQGKFDEYRAAVQNVPTFQMIDLRHQIQTLQKAAIEKFIESGAIPMQIKAQLVRSIRTNDEVEKIMDENTDLKHALLKMRTMYELREVSLATAHEKALGVLRTQISKNIHRLERVEPQEEDIVKADLTVDNEDDTEAESQSNKTKDALEEEDNARKHYIRSVQHLHREIQRLQAQVRMEMRLKTSALDQLQHARANAQALVDADFAKLREEAAETNEKYAEAIRELNVLRSVLEPPKPFHRTQRIAMTPRPKSSSCQRQFESPIKPPIARPQTSRAGPSTRPLRSNQTTVENIMESRPKSAYSTKVREVLKQEIAGTNQSLVPRLQPLYR